MLGPWMGPCTGKFWATTSFPQWEHWKWDAKRLGPRQVRWALLFCRFDFTLTYRPGSKNVRADALSRVFPAGPPSNGPAGDTILPPARVVGVVTWGVESRMAQRTQPDPGGGPPNCLIVPTKVQGQVVKWGHSSHLFCHPGANRVASGGTPSKPTPGSLWPPARSAPAIRPPTGLLRVSSDHCPPPVGHGQTSPLTLSPVSPTQRARIPSWLWSTGFQRWSTSLLSPNSRLRPKRRTSSSPRWSGCMVSPKTSSLTVVPSSCQGSGKPSVRELGPRSTYPRGTIPRPTGRRSGAIRLWRQPCGA